MNGSLSAGLSAFHTENTLRSVFPAAGWVRDIHIHGADTFTFSAGNAPGFVHFYAEHGKIAAEICRKDELLSYFEHVDPAIKEYLDEMLYATLSEYMDLSEAFAYLKRIMDSVVTELFDRYEWLNFYFLKEDHLL